MDSKSLFVLGVIFFCGIGEFGIALINLKLGNNKAAKRNLFSLIIDVVLIILIGLKGGVF